MGGGRGERSRPVQRVLLFDKKVDKLRKRFNRPRTRRDPEIINQRRWEKPEKEDGGGGKGKRRDRTAGRVEVNRPLHRLRTAR